MPTLDEDKILHPRSYTNVIEEMRRDIRMLKGSRPMHVESLDRLSPIAGNLSGATLWIVDAETGITRGIITADPRDETGYYYQVFFNQTGDITFGIDADDGSLFAALGAVVLNEEGIYATAGNIGGWTIEEGQLSSVTDERGIILNAWTPSITIGDFLTGWSTIDGYNQRFYSDNFVTGVSGFNLDLDTGDMEINNLVARGELKSFLLTSQQQMAVAGNIIVSKSAGKLLADAAASDTSVNFGQAMTTGNWIKIQATDATGANSTEWMLIGTLVSGTRYNVTRNVDGSGANDWLADTPFVVIGGPGDSRIELTAGATGSLQLITQGATWNTATVQASMSTQYGAVTAGAGSIRLANSGINILESASGGSYINFYNSAGTTELFGMYTHLDSLWFVARTQGDSFTFNIKLTNGDTPYFEWIESPTNVAQFVINGGTTATMLHIGNDVLIQANRPGVPTVFNDSNINSDFEIWGESTTEPVAWVDASMHRLSIGYDHYLPLKTGTNKDIYFNETGADMDLYYRGTTDDELIHGNAALQSVGFGGDGQSGYKVKIHGGLRITDVLSLDRSSANSFTVTLANNTATSFIPVNAAGGFFISAGAAGGIGAYNTANSGLGIFAGSSIFVAISNTALTGTSGTSGNLSMSCRSADDKIYIENRTGASRVITILLI